MIYLAADHAGYDIKEKVKAHLAAREVSFQDVGAHTYDKDDDYPDFAYEAAKKVAEDPENNCAIVICGSGIGVSITVNKVKGVYCALVWNKEVARSVSEHNNANAIALPARYMRDDEALAIVDEFLQPPSSPVPDRRRRRFEKIKEIEKQNL